MLGCQNFIQQLVDNLESHLATSKDELTQNALILRGVLLTCSYAEFGSVTWHLVTMRVLKILNSIFDSTDSTDLLDKVIAYQPKLIFVDLIMQLQELLSNMLLFAQSQQLYTELFEQGVKALGNLRRINYAYKPEQYQIDAKDFINVAVS